MKRTQIPRCLRRKISLPKDTNLEAPKTESQSPKDTNSEGGQPSKDVKLAVKDTTAEGSTSASKTSAESENPTESETPTKPEAPKNAAKIGEDEYPTVAAAIAAADGSESIVLLRDVTENITINKSLTLNLGGFTLSGDANAAVVTISGDKPQVTVKNGTVTGGRNPQNGGGFAIDSAVVQLEDLTITGNEAVGGNGNGEVGGGGIYASHADVSMRIVTVSENSVTGSSSDGGGILVRYGSLTMDGCHVERNTAPDCGGGMILRHSVLNAAKSFLRIIPQNSVQVSILAIRRTKQKKAVPASTTTLSPIPQSPAIRFSTLKTVSAAVCMSAQPLI